MAYKSPVSTKTRTTLVSKLDSQEEEPNDIRKEQIAVILQNSIDSILANEYDYEGAKSIMIDMLEYFMVYPDLARSILSIEGNVGLIVSTLYETDRVVAKKAVKVLSFLADDWNLLLSNFIHVPLVSLLDSPIFYSTAALIFDIFSRMMAGGLDVAAELENIGVIRKVVSILSYFSPSLQPNEEITEIPYITEGMDTNDTILLNSIFQFVREIAPIVASRELISLIFTYGLANTFECTECALEALQIGFSANFDGFLDVFDRERYHFKLINGIKKRKGKIRLYFLAILDTIVFKSVDVFDSMDIEVISALKIALKEDHRSVLPASNVLINMIISNSDSIEVIVAQEILSTLFQHINDASFPEKAAICDIFCHLLLSSDHRDHILKEFDIIPCLIQVLEAAEYNTFENIISTIIEILRSPSDMNEIIAEFEKAGLKELLEAISDQSPSMHSVACTALQAFSEAANLA